MLWELTPVWNFDWDKYWWLIIILAVLAGPFVQALFAPWRSTCAIGGRRTPSRR